MEDTLRGLSFSYYVEKPLRLNPCSNGRYSQSVKNLDLTLNLS